MRRAGGDIDLFTLIDDDLAPVECDLRRARHDHLSAITRKRRNMDRVAHLAPPHRRRRTPLERCVGITSIIAEGGSLASE